MSGDAIRRHAASAAIAVASLGAVDLALRQLARRGLPAFLHVARDLSPETVLVVTLGAAAAGIAAAGRPGRRVGALLMIAAMSAGLLAQHRLGARLQSDGFYYFAYLRSLAFDRDVNLTNDYRQLGLDDPQHQFLFTPTKTGHAQTAWAIGPAILWSPFFGVAHVVAIRLSSAGEQVDVVGSSFPYRQAAAIAGLFYGLIGLWLTYHFVLVWRSRREAVVGVVATAAGSFVLWYLVREPTMSHSPSMATVALFLCVWAPMREVRTRRGWFALGLCGGLMMVVRWQNVVFLLFPALDLLRARTRGWRTVSFAAALLGAGVLLAFSPQMLAWKAIYGQWLTVSPVGPELRWLDPQISDVLWSSRNGLFVWSPVFLVGVAGLAMMIRRWPSVAWLSLATFGLMVWVNGAVEDWWGGAGFGMRRFDSVVPLIALGVATAVGAAGEMLRARPQAFAVALLAAAVLWNVSMAAVANSGAFRLGQPISFGEIGGLQAATLHRWFGNPFSWPASLPFAVRNRVAPWRYDLLRANRFLGDPRRPYGRVDLGAGDEWLIEDGWHGPERDGAASFRWAATPATLFIPLDRAEPLKVQVRLHAFGYAGAPPQAVTLSINGRAQPALPFGAGWETVELDTPKDAWRAGVNRVRLEFAWTARPMDVGEGNDPRWLAAAIDYVRVSIR